MRRLRRMQALDAVTAHATHKTGQLQFFGRHAHLAKPKTFAAYLAPLRKIEWYLYSTPPFGGPEAVLAYLSRYTHRVAISNRRLVAFDEQDVTFKYKDYRADGRARYKRMTLATDEFIRRFLIHVLPHGSTASATTDCLPMATVRPMSRAPANYSPYPSPTTTRDTRDHNERRAARAAASMSLLRWPHDHHRDLRARLPTKAPAHTCSASDQDRHIMILAPSITDHPDARGSCRLAAEAPKLASVGAIGPQSHHKSSHVVRGLLVQPATHPPVRPIRSQPSPRSSLLNPHSTAKSP